MATIEVEMPSYTLDLNKRTDAFIELLDCRPRWSSEEYIMSLADNLVVKCSLNGRHDLGARIESKVITII